MMRSSGCRMICVLEDHEQRSHADRAGSLQHHANAEQQCGAEREREVRQPHETAADDLGSAIGSERVSADVVEATHDVRARAVGSKVLGGGEMLFEVGEHVGDDLAVSGGRRHGATLHANEQERGPGDERAQRRTEADVVDGEHDQRAREQQRAAEDVDEERDEELGDGVDVAVDAFDQLTGRVLAVVAARRATACATRALRRRLVAVHAWRLATQVRRTVAACAPAATTRYTTAIAASSPVFAPGDRAVDEVPEDDRAEEGQHRSDHQRADEAASARRSGHKWARKTCRGSIAAGSMEPIDATTAIRYPASELQVAKFVLFGYN